MDINVSATVGELRRFDAFRQLITDKKRALNCVTKFINTASSCLKALLYVLRECS